MNGSFRIGDCLIEPQINTITGPDKAARVEPKVMQVLVCLAEHAGEVVSKEKLISQVWAQTFVTDDVLTRSISELRKAFADDSKNPRYIQTIPRGGYRLIAAIAQDHLDEGTDQADIRYQLLDKIAEGGMGEVYLAQDTRLERRVALKILPADLILDDQMQSRFIQEAKLAAGLAHPNICVVLEVGETKDSRPFIAMEYIEGVRLDRKIDRRPLEPYEVVEIGLQIADALDEAHSKRIIHRDIKSANIMITARGVVKVLDFGLAKMSMVSEQVQPVGALAQAAAQRVVAGTVQYMSPEQVLGEEVDHRTDIFSLGGVLYEMATGRRPFKGETVVEVFDHILNKTPVRLLKLNPAVPPELEKLISKAMEKDRERRYQSAAELRRDLRRLKRQMDRVRVSTTSTTAAVIAGPTSKAGRVLVEIKRYRRLLLAVSAALIASAAVFNYLFFIPPAIPKISGYKQITNDGQPKSGGGVTDGPRVYFAENGTFSSFIAQVSAEGGETVRIPTSLTNPFITDISPSGSELLILERLDENTSIVGSLFPLWILPVVGGSPRRVGNVLTNWAAWSPDGQQIVYVNGSDLLLARIDGTDPRKLVTVTGTPWLPRWSPDGSRLRFTIWARGNSLWEARGNSLWEVGADGTNLRPLLPGWNNPPAECCGNWTPDGKYFVFQSTRNWSTNIWVIDEGGSILRKVNPEPVRLTSGPIEFSRPLASKDGKRLIVLGNLRRGELVRYDARSEQFVSYLSGLSADWVNFSRDGGWVTYTSYPEATLLRSKVDGTERRQLTPPPMQAMAPRWSPDGTKIAFTARTPQTDWKIYVVSADGGSPQQLIQGPGPEVDPNWSLDGNTIVFGSFPGNDVTINQLDLRTSQVSKLPGSEGLFSPRLSPDGRYICAIAADLERLVLFDTTTQKWTELVRMFAGFPSWSRDGKYIYFRAPEKNRSFFHNWQGSVLVRLQVGGQKIERVASLKDFRPALGAVSGSWFGLALDDSPMLLREAGSQEIYALDLELP